MTHYVAKHAKVVPFRETTTFKALVFTAVTPAGVAVSGGAAVTQHLSVPAATGAYYGVPAYDHADPYHSDPGGEFTRIDAAPTIGTSSVNFTILGPAE